MKRLVCILSCSVLALVMAAQQQTSVLNRFLQQQNSYTLKADIHLILSEKNTQPTTYTGRLAMRGEKFWISVMNTEASYDGSALYIYSPDTKELNITAPTQEELTESNPLLYAQALVKVCSLSEKQNTQTGETTITLTPKNQSLGIQSFVLKIKTATLLPISIEVREGTEQTKIKFISAQYTQDTPKFILTKPGAYVNDLR